MLRLEALVFGSDEHEPAVGALLAFGAPLVTAGRMVVEHVAAVFPGVALDAAAHAQHTAVQVYVFPPQAQGLALT